MELTAHEALDPNEVGFLALMATTAVVVAQVTDPGSAWDLLLVTPAVLAFVFQCRLTRLPVELRAALVVVPITAVVRDGGDLEPLIFLSVTMVLYMAATAASGVRTAVVAAGAAAAPLVVGLLADDGIAGAVWTMAHGFTYSMGRLLHRQRALILELDAAREALARQAVADERRRIARELHDLAGHTLAAVLLHVTGARHVLRRDLDDAEAALRDAEAVGRASLDQIRATVEALRTDERGTDSSLAAPADLSTLVEEYRRAGLAVEADITAADALDGPVGTAVHRIGREALANVARHAPANQVALRAAVSGGTVVLTVADHGRPPPTAPSPDRGHFGIIGMTERARALGGTLEAGATADGWRVEARLPLVPGGGPA